MRLLLLLVAIGVVAALPNRVFLLDNNERYDRARIGFYETCYYINFRSARKARFAAIAPDVSDDKLDLVFASAVSSTVAAN